MELWRLGYRVRARRVDNNEWRYTLFYGLKCQLIDKEFASNFIMSKRDGKFYLWGDEIKPETLEYRLETDEINCEDEEFKKLELKENALTNFYQLKKEREKDGKI